MSPCVGFRHPQDESTIPLADAPKVLDDLGYMPAEAVQAMVDDIMGIKHKGPYLSPSIMNPDTTCRRQIVGERYLDYIENPTRLWAALEGTFFHWAMAEAGRNLNHDTHVNVRMPAEDDGSHRAEIEVWPGIKLAGEADRVCGDEIIDHKTSRYSKTDYGARNVDEWAIQLNLYRHMYEAMTGRKVTALFVWRTYRGCYEADKTFRKFPIPLLSKETLYEKIGAWAESLRDMLTKAEAIKAEGGDMREFVKTLPMDGADKQMFGAQKCTKYCGLYEVCYALAGKVSF
jgi:hypothetical protein